jgi:hypothetical protein
MTCVSEKAAAKNAGIAGEESVGETISYEHSVYGNTCQLRRRRALFFAYGYYGFPRDCGLLLYAAAEQLANLRRRRGGTDQHLPST